MDNTLPFGQAFSQSWQEWLQYRKERRLPKYAPTGLKKTFTQLIHLSDNNEQTAIKMLERAMSNNWQGFNFKLPNNEQSNFNQQQQQADNFYAKIANLTNESFNRN